MALPQPSSPESTPPNHQATPSSPSNPLPSEEQLAVSPGSSSTSRAIIANAMTNRGAPAELITALKTIPRLEYLYEAPPPKPTQYRIDDHTHAVLRQFEKYFGDDPLPLGVARGVMQLALALHDIGKFIPPSTEEQHGATVNVMLGVREHLPVDDHDFQLMLALIDGDPIGRGFIRLTTARPHTNNPPVTTIEGLQQYCAQSVIVETDPIRIQAEAKRAAIEISFMAQRAGAPIEDFFKLLTIYYQSDSSAYSLDGEFPDNRRPYPCLEFNYHLGHSLPQAPGDTLFVHHPHQKRLLFAERFEPLYQAIADAVAELGRK